MFRNKSVNVHQFAMTPRPEIPRSSFVIESAHKTTFDAGYLIPVYVDEVLPGDTCNLKMTAFARLATPLFPIMDNMYMDSFFFFVPCRLVWDNWQKFMGEQENPGDSTSYIVPIQSQTGGYETNSLQDYMGLPVEAQMGDTDFCFHNALPLRAYNLIWNEWFRDENLQDAAVVDKDDGPDLAQDYFLRRRGKRHDYFTSCLPWPQKGPAVALPLGDTAPVLPLADEHTTGAYATQTKFRQLSGSFSGGSFTMGVAAATGAQIIGGTAPGSPVGVYPTNLYADLSAATGATINALRQSFQIQKLLERDARGGTRYTEIVRSHFGVISPDARLQRPEYLGGGSTPININPIAQTSATAGEGTPLGELGAMGTALAKGHGFTQSFTEHGYIIGLVSVRADLSYQHGMRKMWQRSTRYDFYWPAFAMLGEQAVTQGEMFWTGTANDSTVFGYQERWAEYRYKPSMITGYFKSLVTGTLDAWHLSQGLLFNVALNDEFIQEDPPIERIVAVGEEALGKQFLFDSFFQARWARPLPMYSVPGLIDHF